jgi:basic amino acid/polyamine antiporter, APA family
MSDDPTSPTALPYASVPEAARPQRRLSLFDSVCIIVGVIIGAGIFQTTGDVATAAGGRPIASALLWLAGGAVSLLGALCYAELTTAYPREGGEYVFLSRAFGPRVGFLFAWCGFWIVRPGSIGAMAYVFATSAKPLLPATLAFGGSTAAVALASAAVALISALNLTGLVAGRWTQNVLTVAKVLGILTVIAVACAASAGVSGGRNPLAGGTVDYRLAMILVLFTYGGWNEIAYVAAEVRDPRRQFYRSLIGGVVAVTLIYVAFAAAVWLLTYRSTVDDWQWAFHYVAGVTGSRLLFALVCLSSLGAIQGMIFAGSRIYYAVGADHPAYRWLGRWNPRQGGGTPVRSLLLQGAVTLALVIAFGLRPGSFQAMVVFTTPVFYLFFLLAAVSLFVLRRRDRGVPRPYKVPLYPLTPILFAGSCAFMLWSSLTYAWDNRRWEALWSIVLLLAGIVAGFWTTSEPASTDATNAFPVIPPASER